MTGPTDNAISRGFNTYKKIVPSPAVQSLLVGGLAWGASHFAWNPIVETIRSLARIPGKALGQMTDAEWDQAMDELKKDPTYRRWIPAAVGTLAGAASMGITAKPNRKNWGMFSWNAPVVYNQSLADKKYNQYMYLQPPQTTKTGSLHKTADDLFEYSGYVPEIDLSQTINARHAQSLFTNDPFLQNDNYTRNLGTSIIADAAIQNHTNQPTLGSVFDSAADKIKKKLTLGGLAHVGVRSVMANAEARLLTGVLGTMVSIPQETQQSLIDAGTWAGTITSILR